MKKLTNQTLYQCEYCGKRLLSKKGADLHEKIYCKDYDSPAQQNIIQRQKLCKHENTVPEYGYIPGEAVQQIECDRCIDCGAAI